MRIEKQNNVYGNNHHHSTKLLGALPRSQATFRVFENTRELAQPCLTNTVLGVYQTHLSTLAPSPTPLAAPTFYVKFSSCSATASAANTYSYIGCSQAMGGITADIPGNCIVVTPAGSLAGAPKNILAPLQPPPALRSSPLLQRRSHSAFKQISTHRCQPASEVIVSVTLLQSHPLHLPRPPPPEGEPPSTPALSKLHVLKLNYAVPCSCTRCGRPMCRMWR